MQPDPPLSVVRQKVAEAFEAMGVGDGQCSEKIILDDGYVVGQRFCQGGFQAVWLAGERCIRIFNEAGELIDTQPLAPADVIVAGTSSMVKTGNEPPGPYHVHAVLVAKTLD